jgi:hypothetical protein
MAASTAAPIERKRILMAVTAYPQPVAELDEMVCTAGIDEDGRWIRIYPVPLAFLTWSKFHIVEMDLRRNFSDPRPESFNPVNADLRDLVRIRKLGPDEWGRRTRLVSSTVYESKARLLTDSKRPDLVSLATFRPTQFLEFEIENASRDWPAAWLARANELDLFVDKTRKNLIRKVPYKFYYSYEDEKGVRSRQRIIDWEIGQLYWNALRIAEGDEDIAVSKVREKYWDRFVSERDLYLFLGTTERNHFRAPNPFLIIGVYYPPKPKPAPLFD